MPYTPGQVSEMLKIPTSTIRLYAKLYSDYLSPQEGRERRLYTENDLVILARIKDLRSAHVKMDEIKRRLLEVPKEPVRVEESALTLIPTIATAIESAQAAARAAQNRADQLARLQEDLSQPWYKKLFKSRSYGQDDN